MSRPVKLPAAFLLRCGLRLKKGMILSSRRHKERNSSRSLPRAMRSLLYFLEVILLPQIGYPICMCPIIGS
jgi:hypothetical protein